MLSILAFIYGASLGSFVQVVVGRLHVAPIMKGRSKCLSCGEALRVSDLVPLFSCLFLRGRCRYCKAPFGFSSVVVEAIFGISFLLLYQCVLRGQATLLMSVAWLVYYTTLFAILGVIALYDRAHSYIPARFLLGFLLLSGMMFIVRLFGSVDIVTLLSPVIVASPFFIVWLITKKKGLGFGDIIMFFGIGAFFGVSQGFAVFMLSVWMGAIYGLYYKYIAHKGEKVSSAIPFVPFIVLAFLVVLFTDVDVVSIAMFFA